MKIDIRETLHFFDDKQPPELKGHTSGVMGVMGEDLNAAVFAHYMTQDSGEARVLDNSVTLGTREGRRLDRWILVSLKGTTRLYQAEIKNWAREAIGGKIIPLDIDKGKLFEIADKHWQRQISREFRSDEQPNGVSKVLLPMRPPEGYEKTKVEPLIIYWMPVAKDSTLNPYFTKSTSSLTDKLETPFKKLHVFSVSLYLRELVGKGDTSLNLPMPNAQIRLDALHRIVKQ